MNAAELSDGLDMGGVKVSERSEIMEASIFVQGTTFIRIQVKF